MIHRLFRTFELRSTPPENKNVVWFDSTKRLLKIYENGEWTVYTPEDCILLERIDLTEEQKSTVRSNIDAISANAVTTIVDKRIDKSIDSHISNNELIKSIQAKVEINTTDINNIKNDISNIKDTLNWKKIE